MSAAGRLWSLALGAGGVVVAILVLAAAVVDIRRHAAQPDGWPLNGLVLLTFFCAVLLGEIVNAHDRRSTRTADIGATSALALALTIQLPDGPTVISTVEVVAVTAAGLVLGGLIGAAVRSGHPTGLVRAILPRLVTVAVVSIILRDIPWGGGPSLDQRLLNQAGWLQASVLLVVVGSVLFVEAPLRHLGRLRPERLRWPARVVEDIRETFALGAVAATTAVLVSVAQVTLGLAALPVLLVPLVINNAAVRRHDEVRHSYRQSVAALSCLPEAAGLVRRGHAASVADLSVRIGSQLGLHTRALAELERAALLHDLGQAHLRRPMPGGATVLAAPGDQERIAAAGADIARATGTLAREADIIDAQAVPYHHVVARGRDLPLGSRIVKVANAFDDLVSDADITRSASDTRTERTDGELSQEERVESVMERLYLGLGHEYDPRVVNALAEVLAGREPGTSPRGGRGVTA